MATKILFLIATASILLMGCAQSDRYPITGMTIGDDDQVKILDAPDGVHF